MEKHCGYAERGIWVLRWKTAEPYLEDCLQVVGCWKRDGSFVRSIMKVSQLEDSISHDRIFSCQTFIATIDCHFAAVFRSDTKLFTKTADERASLSQFLLRQHLTPTICWY
jgi:hypothetical protein